MFVYSNSSAPWWGTFSEQQAVVSSTGVCANLSGRFLTKTSGMFVYSIVCARVANLFCSVSLIAFRPAQMLGRLSVYTEAELLLPRFDEEEFLTEMFVGGPPKVTASV